MGRRRLKENSITFTKRESLQYNRKNYDLGVRRPGFSPGPSADLVSDMRFLLLLLLFVSEKQLPHRKMRKYSEVSFVTAGVL